MPTKDPPRGIFPPGGVPPRGGYPPLEGGVPPLIKDYFFPPGEKKFTVYTLGRGQHFPPGGGIFDPPRVPPPGGGILGKTGLRPLVRPSYRDNNKM